MSERDILKEPERALSINEDEGDNVTGNHEVNTKYLIISQ